MPTSGHHASCHVLPRPALRFWDAGGQPPAAAYADLVAGDMANVLRGGNAQGTTVSVRSLRIGTSLSL